MSQIASTYKARDVEEVIDIVFYRPFGYVLARASHVVGLTPNGVTILSIFVGVFGGHLFYYPDLRTNIIGMLLFVFSDALDSADGQLARITNHYTRLGRVLDGLATNLVFISIYTHLCLRFMAEGGTPFIFLLALAAGVSHSFQSAMADYYRNAYLHFVYGEDRSELDKSSTIDQTYRRLSWRRHAVKKLLLRMYLNYTLEQESLSKNFQRLYGAAKERFGSAIPEWLKGDYRARNKPLLKYYNMLTTNTRVIALFVCVSIDRATWYFLFEIFVLNALLVAVTLYQERLNLLLLEKIGREGQVHPT